MSDMDNYTSTCLSGGYFGQEFKRGGLLVLNSRGSIKTCQDVQPSSGILPSNTSIYCEYRSRGFGRVIKAHVRNSTWEKILDRTQPTTTGLMRRSSVICDTLPRVSKRFSLNYYPVEFGGHVVGGYVLPYRRKYSSGRGLRNPCGHRQCYPLSRSSRNKSLTFLGSP